VLLGLLESLWWEGFCTDCKNSTLLTVCQFSIFLIESWSFLGSNSDCSRIMLEFPKSKGGLNCIKCYTCTYFQDGSMPEYNRKLCQPTLSLPKLNVAKGPCTVLSWNESTCIISSHILHGMVKPLAIMLGEVRGKPITWLALTGLPHAFSNIMAKGKGIPWQ
jgi:hypothetical protein